MSKEEGAATPGGSRAQYVSANCVVFTHYQGDAAAVVDEHFSRALDKNTHAKGKFFFLIKNKQHNLKRVAITSLG